MAKRILVPLDDISTVEGVLTLVADVARSAGATVRLLHVELLPGNLYSSEGRTVVYADQEMDRLDTEWRERMEAFAGTRLEGVPFESTVRFGDPAEEILAEIESFGADLVVVPTATRSSLKRALLGSVAEALVRKAPVTVMLVRQV
jgi:nucleotide-binding universal stress UspA family protein